MKNSLLTLLIGLFLYSVGHGQTPVEVHVSTVEEMMREIDDNKKIFLEPGTYNLGNLPDIRTEQIGMNGVHDGKAYQLLRLTNLALIGPKEGEAKIVVKSRYATVLNFINVKNITLKNITFGHTESGGGCYSGVLRFANAENIKITNCKLYGSGTFGLVLENVNDVEFSDSEIYECTSMITDIKNSNNISFLNSKFYKNGCYINIANSTSVSFVRCDISDNKISGNYESTHAIFNLKNTSQVQLINSLVVDNHAGGLIMDKVDADMLIQNSNTIKYNSFQSKEFQISPLGEFHGFEVSLKTGDKCMGMYFKRGEEKLVKMEAIVKTQMDPITDGEEAEFTGKYVTIPEGTSPPNLLIKGPDGLFKEGPLSTAKLIHHKIPDYSPQDSLRNKFMPNYLLPGESMDITMKNGNKYTFSTYTDEEFLKKRGWEKDQYYTLTLKDHQTNQIDTLYKHVYKSFYYGEYTPPYILWAGDLDNDGKLDLYMNAGGGYNSVLAVALFLSSRALRGKMLKMVASFSAVGC